MTTSIQCIKLNFLLNLLHLIHPTLQNKRNQQAEERAKKRLEEIEARRKMMDERRSKWEEERWKREEGREM